MRSSPSPSEPISTPFTDVPRLTFSTAGGEPYRRRDDVVKKIIAALEHPRTEWAEMARHKGEKKLPDEALVFLIRKCFDGDRNLFGCLISELTSRTIRIAERWAQGFDPCTTEEIVKKVDDKIIDLLLMQRPSPTSEFLEVAFGNAVRNETLKMVEKFRQDALSRRGGSVELSTDETMAQIPAQNLDMDEVIIQLADEVQRSELIRMAQAAVKDSRHLEAVILRHVYGWPFTDSDPNKPSLDRHFKMSGRQIQNWINETLKIMYTAIGDKR
jgi:hypothetical protein